MNQPRSQNDFGRTNQLYERHWSDQYSASNNSLSESMQPPYNHGFSNSSQQTHWSDFSSQSSYAYSENLQAAVNYGGSNIVQQPHWSDFGTQERAIPENQEVLWQNMHSNSRTSQANKGNQFSQVLILGDSWVKHFTDGKNIALENGIQFDFQWWPNANVETIMQNLENYIKPFHKNLLLFCLISETWRYETLENIPNEDDSPLYKILMPNPEFSVLDFVEKFTELRSFCNHLNPNLKVFLMTPPRIDVYQFNLELVSKFPESCQELFYSNSKYEASRMAEYSKEIYGKIIEMCNSNHGWPEKSIFRNQIIAQKVKSCQKLFTKFMKSKVDTCGKEGPFVDGIHPTIDFIKVFWDQIKSWLDIVDQNPEPINEYNKNARPTIKSEYPKQDGDNNYQAEYGEDFNLDSIASDYTTGFSGRSISPGNQPLPLSAPNDVSKMVVNRVGMISKTLIKQIKMNLNLLFDRLICDISIAN